MFPKPITTEQHVDATCTTEQYVAALKEGPLKITLAKARERLADYATELEATVAGGGTFFAPTDCAGFAVCLRVTLDALQADAAATLGELLDRLQREVAHVTLDAHSFGSGDLAPVAAARAAVEEYVADLREAAALWEKMFRREYKTRSRLRSDIERLTADRDEWEGLAGALGRYRDELRADVERLTAERDAERLANSDNIEGFRTTIVALQTDALTPEEAAVAVKALDEKWNYIGGRMPMPTEVKALFAKLRRIAARASSLKESEK